MMADNRFFNLMIISDIDGTFIGPDKKMIQRNLTAVERFKAQGGLFTFSSGRASGNIFAAVPEAAKIANAPLSLANGACLFDAVERRSLKDFFMEPESALDVAKYLRSAYSQTGLRVSDSRGFVIEPNDLVVLDNLKRVGQAHVSALPVSQWCADDWYKMVVVGDPELIDLVRADCAERFSEANLAYDKSEPNLLEIHRGDRNKATMLDTYRELYAAEGRELVFCGVGDFENDRELLEAADISVCPENAVDSMKKICDLCLCHHSLGVIADLVEYLEENYGVPGRA